MSRSIAAHRPYQLSLLASIALCGAFASAPAFSASTTAAATADVVTPIAITKASDLAFGRFIAGPGGTVTVNTAGLRTLSGVTAAGGTTATTASFNITGEASTAYSISIDASDTRLVSGANEMTLELFSDLTGAGAVSGKVNAGLLSAAGTQTLYVGGKLSVNADQAGGQYSGTIAALVNYN
jgi:hypothetical protein